jgi:hypothetical protein
MRGNLSNFKQLLIAKDIATTATAGTTIASPSTIANGEVCVTDETGRVLANNTSGLTSLKHVRLVQGQGSNKPLIISPLIPRTARAVLKGYQAAVEQVSYIGFNAANTSGFFDSLSNMGEPSPQARTTFRSRFHQYHDKLMEAISGYNPISSDTISTFVAKLANAMYNEIKRYVQIPYMVERVNSVSSGTTVLGAAATFTKGSTLVTCSNLGTLAVGDYIRVGTHSDVTAPIYRVTSLSAGVSFTIDQAFQGTSIVGNAAASTRVVTPVTTTGSVGAGWGIKLTGLPMTNFKENVIRYEKINWVTTVQNMGSTTVSDHTKAYDGNGTYEQVAEEEVFMQLSEGFADNATIQIPNVEWRKNVDTAGTYASIEIFWVDQPFNPINIAGTGVDYKAVKVYGDNDGANAFVANSTFYDSGSGEQDVYSVLNAYLASGVEGSTSGFTAS